MDFLEEQFGFECDDWDDALLDTICGLILTEPKIITQHIVTLMKGTVSAESQLLLGWIQRKKKVLGLPSKTDDCKLADWMASRFMELTILLYFMFEHQFGKDRTKNCALTVERLLDSLSIHYAIDVKPSPAFVNIILRLGKSGDRKISKLAQKVIDGCGIDNGSSEDEENEQSEPRPRPSIPLRPSLSYTQGFSQEPPTPKFVKPFSRNSLSQKEVMSPITLNSHWTRLKGKTLRRRSTDTDLSRLVDLQTVSSRLSQPTQSQSQTQGSQQTAKRKGVLVHVGTLTQETQPSQTDGSQDIISCETPVKLHRASQASQMTATQMTDFSATTGGSLVILETPPRASIGAAACRVAHGHHPLPFKLE